MKRWMVILLGAVMAISTAAIAKEKPAMDPAAMAQIQKLSSPGPQHQVLEPLIGNWKHTVKWRMSPGEKPQTSQGTNTNHWIFGNRFLQQEVKGEMMGQPFEGLSITGYDNVREEYTSIWLDNVSTGMMTGTSQFNPKTHTFAESGTFSCPMAGEKDKKYRATLKIINRNQYRYNMYTTDKTGKEFKSLEINYTRVK